MKGSQFYKTDLHIHTPASKCYAHEDKGVSAQEIVEKSIQEGLQIIAITDHNDISFINEVQKATKGKDLLVFPGIEITATNAHILAIFDPKCPLRKLDDLLTTVGITSDKRGMKDALAKDAEIVIKEISNFGGIAIASHANSSSGLLKHPQGNYKTKIYKMPELVALEFNDKEDVEKFCIGEVSQYPAKACVMGSDAHSLGEIGTRFTYFKMDAVFLDSLKLALLDHEIKIKYPWDDILTKYPYIKQITVDQGFFKGITFDFHPNLNCILGGRGTGKSTVIEFLRYCFDDISNFEDIKEDTLGKVDKLVGTGGKITTLYADENEEELTIERKASNPEIPWEESPTIRTATGENTALSAKPVFFSQGEISRITSSQIAQLELIDRYIEIDHENNEEKKLTDGLKANTAKQIEARNNHRVLVEEVNDPETGKLATKAHSDKLERSLKNPIFSEFPKWESEGRYIASLTKEIDKLMEGIRGSFEDVDIESAFPSELDVTSPNFSILKSLTRIPATVKEDLNACAKSFEAKMEQRKKEIQDIYKKWVPLFNAKQKAYEKSIEEIGGENIKAAQAKLRAFKKRLDDLENKERETKNWSKKIEEFTKQRGDLLKMLMDARAKRYAERLSKAKEWENAFGGEVKIDIIPGGNRWWYFNKLGGLLTGSYIQDREIRKIADAVAPYDLVEAVLTDQVELISTNAAVGIEISRRLIEHLKKVGLDKLYDLEVVNLPDRPVIKFETEPGKEKPLNELSVGTKSTIIVSLAMIEGNAPLIIDQPEDSLDTQFIYHHIVKKLRKEKDARQFIFTTHNPNVVVAGDADLSYVLDATSDKGEIKSSGGIDQLDTNRLVLLHLEGGPDAFHLRAQKYLK